MTTPTESPPGYDDLDALLKLAVSGDIHGIRQMLAEMSEPDFAQATKATLEVRQHHAEIFESVLRLIALEGVIRQDRRDQNR